MNEPCVICNKKLGLGVSRFPHLMQHMVEGTAHAQVDFKNEYWYFQPTIKGMQRYKGWKIQVAEGGESHALRTPETEKREGGSIQEGQR